MSILDSVKLELNEKDLGYEIDIYEALFSYCDDVGLEVGKGSWIGKKLKTVKDAIDRATNSTRFNTIDELLKEPFENITFTKAQVLALKIPIGPHTNALLTNNISLELLAKSASDVLSAYKDRSGATFNDDVLFTMFNKISLSFLNKPFFRWNSELLKFRFSGVKLSAIKLAPLTSVEGVSNVQIKDLSKINLLRENSGDEKKLAYSLKFSLGGGVLFSNEYTKFSCDVIKHLWDEFGNLATKVDTLNTNAVYRNQHSMFQTAMFVYNYMLNMGLHTKYLLAQIEYMLNHIDSTYGKLFSTAKKVNKTLQSNLISELIEVPAPERDLAYYQKLIKEANKDPSFKGFLFEQRIPVEVLGQILRGDLINTYVVD